MFLSFSSSRTCIFHHRNTSKYLLISVYLLNNGVYLLDCNFIQIFCELINRSIQPAEPFFHLFQIFLELLFYAKKVSQSYKVLTE